jgi:hypothetical protein
VSSPASKKSIIYEKNIKRYITGMQVKMQDMVAKNVLDVILVNALVFHIPLNLQGMSRHILCAF